MNSHANMRLAAETVYKLPVVVHVITSSECEELSSVRYKHIPSDELIHFEVEEASQRFRHNYVGARTYTNPYYGIDTGIELALATVDPNGEYTPGIERIVDPEAEGKPWELIYPVIDKYKWDTEKYCNIFIVKGMTNASGVFIEGNDFTIYSTNTFWSGLMNHELGHYLGLNHIFTTENGGCPSNTDCLMSGDGICDTPPKYSAGSLDEACAGNIVNSCTSDEADVSTNNPYRPIVMGGMGDQPDMVTNYMDYTGNCWDSYTLGQKIRMRTMLETKTAMIAFSAIAFSNPTPAYYLHVRNINLVEDGCTGKHIPVVEIENKGTSQLSSVNILIMDGTSIFSQLGWTGTLAPGESTEISFPGVNITNTLYVLKAVFENPDNQSTAVYETGNCKQLDFVNYHPADPLSIPFAACNNSELGTVSNDVTLTWSTETFTPFHGYQTCRECVGALLNQYTAPYLIQRASFELRLRDFTSFTKPELGFKMGYIPHEDSGPFDTLSVKISAECGAFETVWKATGLELATNNPAAYHNLDGYYIPLCTQYKDIAIDLEQFTGKKDIRIKVEARGKFMGPLLLDDIVINNNMVSAINKATKEREFIFTNPVEDELIIESKKKFELFQILNLTGQVILRSQGTHINVSHLNPGLYFLVAQSDNRNIVQKFLKE
ncbi:MAG: zinc-dependent metalloprotease [Bacteroidia bacterium]